VSDDHAAELPFDRALLERWRPALRHDAQEPYRAISARSITDNPGNQLLLSDGAVLARAEGEAAAKLTLELLADYPGNLEPREADRLDEAADELAAARRFQEDPVYANRAYGRIASHGGYTWLQYWLWFYYNPKHLLGFGRHEGDWELVQLALDEAMEPKLVTCSQHETGEARAWPRVSKEPYPDGEHPAVYVAPFSHAVYFEPGAHPYLGGIDNPDGSRAPLLPEIEELGAWRSWPGRWGNSEGVLAELGARKLGGRSPKSPARQGTRWERPSEYHREGQRVSVWRRVGRGVRLVGTLSYPRLASLEAELKDQLLFVRYELERGPLTGASLLYVTVHRPPDAEAGAGAVGEILLSRAVGIDARKGELELLVPEAVEECVVFASAFNRLRQRSDPLQVRAVRS
jgi:hypothetical protein